MNVSDPMLQAILERMGPDGLATVARRPGGLFVRPDPNTWTDTFFVSRVPGYMMDAKVWARYALQSFTQEDRNKGAIVIMNVRDNRRLDVEYVWIGVPGIEATMYIVSQYKMPRTFLLDRLILFHASGDGT